MSPLSWWFDYWAGAFDAYVAHLGTWTPPVTLSDSARAPRQD
jgi:hypothetical protein